MTIEDAGLRISVWVQGGVLSVECLWPMVEGLGFGVYGLASGYLVYGL